MKQKSPESQIKSKQVKDRRRRNTKAISIQSKSGMSDGSMPQNLLSKAAQKKSLSICKQPSQQQAMDISGEVQSSGRQRESDTAEAKYGKSSSPDAKKVSDFSGVFMVTKSHFFEGDVARCLCTMRRLRLKQILKSKRPSRKTSKRAL